MISRAAWGELARAVCDGNEIGFQRLRCLAINLEVARRLRPALYETAMKAIEWTRPIFPDRSLDYMVRDFEAIEGECQYGRPLAIMGIGDGRMLASLVSHPPEMANNQQQPLYVVEPDPASILFAMSLTDLRGVFNADRVRWYVGPNWLELWRNESIGKLTYKLPLTSIVDGRAREELRGGIDVLLEEFRNALADVESRTKQWGESINLDELIDVMGQKPSRKPRVLLMVSRFTTVLKGSTCDAANAFEKLGWDVMFVSEEHDWHSQTIYTAPASIARHRPDLIFQIDHHRTSFGEAIPKSIPYINWIQDHFGHLTCVEAGRAMGPRDFALIASVERYIRAYEYPEHQCMEMRKLTRFISDDELPSMDFESRQVIYASTWSHNPERRAALVIEGLPDRDARRLARSLCDRLLEESRVGIIPSLPGEVRAMARSMESELKIKLAPTLFDQTVVDVTEQLVNLLYRRQALFWAQQCCDELNLDLNIYGRGWENDPHLSRHARKHIAYGSPLAQATRRAAINLVLEPYVCVSHQRLLDGLAWGGFFLIRNHPSHQFYVNLVRWIDRAGHPLVRNADELRHRLDETERIQFEAFFAATSMTQVVSQDIDLVATTSRMIRNGFVDFDQPLVPDFESVAFDSADELRDRMKRALDPTFRARVINRQRERVYEQFDYSRGIARAIAFVRNRLIEERASQARPQTLAA